MDATSTMVNHNEKPPFGVLCLFQPLLSQSKMVAVDLSGVLF